MAETETQYGARYPDETIDWRTATWFGSIDTPEARRNFEEQYRLRLASLGVPMQDLEFVTRERTTTYTVTEVLVDPAIDEDPDGAPASPESE